MRPLCYSEHDAAERDVGWVRSGSRICYYQNQYASQAPPKKIEPEP